jgi:uncharacterized protein (TIGR02145 family)
MKYLKCFFIISGLFFSACSIFDSQSPTVNITYPVHGSTVEGTVRIKVDVQDDTSIEKVEFYINGQLLFADIAIPWEYSWNTSSCDKGQQYTILAKAYDQAGNIGNSLLILVTIPEDVIIIYETGTMSDIDGNTYNTVKIGNQWWMAENLKVIHYRNGDTIPEICDNSEWADSRTGARCNYNNDDNNNNIYGCLYNSYATDDNRVLAPENWHIPTLVEWNILVDYIGDSPGGKLKYAGPNYWVTPNVGATNSVGFSVLPGGHRWNGNGWFDELGESAYFWASDIMVGDAGIMSLYYNSSRVYPGTWAKTEGLSIRCVKN